MCFGVYSVSQEQAVHLKRTKFLSSRRCRTVSCSIETGINSSATSPSIQPSHRNGDTDNLRTVSGVDQQPHSPKQVV